ncbi:hypothetical protein TraAM80_01803 [Trypanosoma rangeli]|uniref:ZC3H15/TMA46 family C-terminal domain-containing protein n=1 Tax=Trypanosoma rangeli TaxID=5698 RepID=A0A3R7M6G6_TRYRA|nr:uncharacterized protein TraAM80_01803 [Trypanosoma rangeli]RNF09964.1 hypothetical protein TraAM80_01803 [Trypanosoma rangeli]|eukprot:RNF09964.1 hypothetical protein TraAM80_01803 [Trypanosoma rangeli]
MGKKAEQKKKEKILEDKTFGLKNKNRSSKVQSYIQSVSKSVNQGNPNERKRTDELDAKRKAREEKRAFEAEMAKLFKDVGGPGKPVTHGPLEEGDAEDADRNLGCAPEDYLFRPEDFEEVQHDERRLEEKLEAEREALKDRTDLTPVTEESFQAWKAAKRVQAAELEAVRVRKAKAGEGKLRGWDLWQMDKELFVDDDDADEEYEREESVDDDNDEEAAYDLS